MISKLLKRRAGHGIRTRDFDLGKSYQSRAGTRISRVNESQNLANVRRKIVIPHAGRTRKAAKYPDLSATRYKLNSHKLKAGEQGDGTIRNLQVSPRRASPG